MKILVVEFEEMIRFLVGEKLSEIEGRQVRTASGKEEALELLAQEEVDFLITDQGMNRPKEGSELIEEVQKRFPDTRCILMSGNHDNISEADHLGVPFLAKPFSYGELEDLLKPVAV